MSLPKIKFYSATTNASAPLVCGQVFKQGDVPAGSQVIGMQCTPKTTWPDGSLKFGVMSAVGSITAGVPLEIQLTVGTPTTASPVAIAALKARTPALSIGCGSFGTATWSASDLDTPFMTWVSGPTMSTWIYRKPVGSDAHLVAWLRVRMWSNGAVEVLPWIENGYLLVTGPTNKSATYTFSMGGTQRISVAIDLKHHERTPLISGTAVGYWMDADPGISVSHDKAYMASTDMVLTYGISRSATGLATLPASYTPLQFGGIIYTDNRDGPDKMANPGYQRPIGIVGEHDAAYIFCNDQPELLYAAVIRNGFSAGRYPIHYRDETTNRAPVMLNYQELIVDNLAVASLGAGNQTTPHPTGGETTVWDGAHHPSCGYMAYLVTGDFYHLETSQLICTGNFFTINCVNLRAGGNRGRFIPDYESVQTRSAAWGWRSLAQAAAITPDDDPLQASFIAVATTLINYYHATFVAQPNNQFGFIETGESQYGNTPAGGLMVAPWQDDFFTMSVGHMRALGLPLTTTVQNKLAAFFDWKAKCIIGRIGDANGFRFEHCATYGLDEGAGPGALPDYQGGTGPWPASWKVIYDATVAFEVARGQTWFSPLVPNTIASEYDISVWPKSMLGNLMPAIVYAKRFGVPGADASYARLTGATNWPQIQTAFADAPVWYAVPSGNTSGGVTLPAPTGPSIAVSTGLINGKIAIKGYSGSGLFPAQFASGFAERGRFTDDIVGALSTDQFTDDIDTIPAGLTFTAYQDGSFSASGVDGTYVVSRTLWKNGVASSSPLTIIFGVVTPAVTGVTVSPSAVTQATGTIAFTPVAATVGGASAALNRTLSGPGSINPSNVYTLPAQTLVVQTATVTWTSDFDPSKSATATITIPALSAGTVRTVRKVLKLNAMALAANLSGLKVAFYDEASPDLFSVPKYQSASESTDSFGAIGFTYESVLAPGGTGYMVLKGPGVQFNGPVGVS